MQLLVYRSLSHYLLLPWPAVSEADQQWEARAAQHGGFVAKLTHDFLQLRAANLSRDVQLQQQGQLKVPPPSVSADANAGMKAIARTSKTRIHVSTHCADICARCIFVRCSITLQYFHTCSVLVVVYGKISYHQTD